MLQDELATLRLEIDALKQHWEKEENYFENMEILKVKNDDLQKAVKLSEETLTKTLSHYTGQLNALTAENTMLTSKLENEKKVNKDWKLVKSYVLDWLLPYTIMIKVRHQKEIWNLPSREQRETSGYACRTKCNSMWLI